MHEELTEVTANDIEVLMETIETIDGTTLLVTYNSIMRQPGHWLYDRKNFLYLLEWIDKNRG